MPAWLVLGPSDGSRRDLQSPWPSDHVRQASATGAVPGAAVEKLEPFRLDGSHPLPDKLAATRRERNRKVGTVPTSVQ